MALLAPSLCPVCDRQYDDRHLDPDSTTEIWFHYRLKEKCVRDEHGERTEPIVLPQIG